MNLHFYITREPNIFAAAKLGRGMSDSFVLRRFFEVYKLGSRSLAAPNLEKRAQVFSVSSRVPKIRASTSQEWLLNGTVISQLGNEWEWKETC